MSKFKLPFNNSYITLPEHFYSKTDPTPVSSPKVIAFNHALATQLNLDGDQLKSHEGIEVLAGNIIAEGSEPLAQAYSGHQFGNFNPQLGDGRALLLGEVIDRNGIRKDIQLKGSGPTPFSRNGDGRSALGPVIREYIVSEAMFALGVPTTRALAALTTGDKVFREGPTPGGILTRVASSHIRIGTFQFFAARGDHTAIKTLADYCIERHYPNAKTTQNPYVEFFTQIMHRQARLVTHWMQLGFIHGVMNTDNMTISGETIDYGPCAFMEAFDPNTVLSYIDSQGRYAYANQASIAQWNLARLAETLLPLFHPNSDQAIEIAQTLVKNFSDYFKTLWLDAMREKIGLVDSVQRNDETLVERLLELMHEANADFTLSFRALSQELLTPNKNYLATHINHKKLNDWATQWHLRLHAQNIDLQQISANMNNTNPLYIPRNHWVEAAINAGVQQNDFSLMQEMDQVLKNPFTRQDGKEKFAQAAQIQERVTQTFCGT